MPIFTYIICDIYSLFHEVILSVKKCFIWKIYEKVLLWLISTLLGSTPWKGLMFELMWNIFSEVFVVHHLLIWKILVWHSRTLEPGLFLLVLAGQLGFAGAQFPSSMILEEYYILCRILTGLTDSMCKAPGENQRYWAFSKWPEYINILMLTVLTIHTVVTIAVMLLVVWIPFSLFSTITH